MRQDLVVTKSNSLVEASYRLNVSEQRVVALLAAQIHPDDEDFKPYRFRVSELQALMDNNSKSVYAEVKDLTRGLMKRVIQINEADGPLQVAWLSSAKYFTGKGEVELCFDPKMKTYLLQLQSRFTSFKLANVIKLRSRYSVRIYELLKQYEGLGSRSFELTELRRIIGLAPDELSRWNDFHRKVLDVAKRELPQKTDLGFNYSTRKNGRAVASVSFEIWSARKKDPTSEESKAKQIALDKCYRENGHTSCRATWANHNEPHRECHYCKKFDQKRAELAGQTRLPGLD